MSRSGSLDLAFVLDCTLTMTPHIDQARQRIKDIVTAISGERGSVNMVNVRLALVQFRDHDSPDYATRIQNFTNLNQMKHVLDLCDVGAGVDMAEGVACGLYDAAKLDWKSESRICVLVTDAAPHGLRDWEDPHWERYPNGCPLGRDPIQIANSLGEKGVTLHMLAVEPDVSENRDFYMALTWITGGLYIPLSNAGNMANIIIGSAKETLSLQKIKDKVRGRVRERIDPRSGELNAKPVSEDLHAEFQEQGVKVFQLKFRDGHLPKMTGRAKRYARFDKLSEIKPLFRVYSGVTGGTSGQISLEEREETVTLLQVQRMVQQAFLMCRAEAC